MEKKNTEITRENTGKGNGMLEVVFILDRSGSMGGLEEDTIGGFNAMLEKQLKESDNVIWSTVLFDHVQEVIHDRLPIRQISPLTEEEYYVRGTTALLDSIGRAIRYISRAHRILKEKAPEKTLFVITTDGRENSSEEFSRKRVKSMIERRQEEYGWEFIFLGANIDAVQEAGSIGIRQSRAANYLNDGEGVRRNYEVVGSVMSKMSRMEVFEDECLDEIRKDFTKRGRRKDR